MTLNAKYRVIALLSAAFIISLILVQYMEVTKRREEAGLVERHISVPVKSQGCVDCHNQQTPAIISHWEGSTHALKGVGCIECHEAKKTDPDHFDHYGTTIATVVTPLDCSKCHEQEFKEFEHSHHAKAGNILASLDNFLAETVEGSRADVNPHSPTPGRPLEVVNGMASAASGCQQCHGSKVALKSTDGGMITVDDLKPDENGKPTNVEILAKIMKNDNERPMFHEGTWPNTGIGRLNLDGSLGSCSACHSRHDFSPRRARQPENCGKCHLGPDHPQKEVYEESKHGVAFRDMKHKMNLNSKDWVLGKDYSAAPTCATCHMSGHMRNDGKVTHDPGERISWTNRPPVSRWMDTDINHKIVGETDPAERQKLIHDSGNAKRGRMKQVCSHCHTPDYINGFYKQYDGLVMLYNEKFAKPGQMIMAELLKQDLRTKTQFDEEIEWTWFYLWHHEGRRARHGASMMAPDYTHWHGMYEVAERFYMELIPQAREIIHHAKEEGKADKAKAIEDLLTKILSRTEHKWFEGGAEADAERIRKAMEKRYGKAGEGNTKPPAENK